MDKLEQSLENEKQKFFIYLNRFKNIFPTYKTNPIEEIENIYKRSEDEINKSFERLYMIKNEVLVDSDYLASNMETKDEYIKNVKGKLEQKKNKLKNVKAHGYASIPRSKDREKIMNQYIIYSTIQGLFLFGNTYLLYKILSS